MNMSKWFFMVSAVILQAGAVLTAGKIGLDELELVSIRQGWGQPMMNKTVSGAPIRLKGKTYTQGFGTHSPSACSFMTGKGETTFRAVVGLDDETLPERGSVVFNVKAGDRVLWSSGRVQTGDEPKPCEVVLPPLTRITLEVDPDGPDSYDHAVWADAFFSFTEEAPGLPLKLPVGVINVADYGILPSPECDAAPLTERLLLSLKAFPPEGAVTLSFPKGEYHFYDTESARRVWYISNHDQDNPRKVGFALEALKDFTLDGNGSDFIFHGRMMQIGAVDCKNLTIRNLSLDFKQPQITQLNITGVDAENKTVTFSLLPGTAYTIQNGRFTPGTEGWSNQPGMGILFEPGTKRVAYRTSDFGFNLANVEEVSPGVLLARNVGNASRMSAGQMFAARSWHRPCPGIFLSECTDTLLENVTVHYSEGMGLIAQLCDNIILRKFNVALRGESDPRAFTTQADATHFSGCKGVILSEGGLYEGMMDDAINVHGTYLKVTARPNDTTLRGRYMHGQSWGFKWGDPGDAVQFVLSKTMEIVGDENRVKSITALDKPVNNGCREFEITFENPLDAAITPEASVGIENLTWTPSVIFRGNTVRNNRARGALFSTPKSVLVEDNFFDHTSGCAILLCGDCNGWYETGACRDVVIRKNRFLNALTSGFQFTAAVISIYPEIPDLKGQKKYFHSGIVIEDNLFETFDRPLVYAKSTDGLVFRKNVVKKNTDYPPWHPNKTLFKLERVKNLSVTENTFPEPVSIEKDFSLWESETPELR